MRKKKILGRSRRSDVLKRVIYRDYRERERVIRKENVIYNFEKQYSLFEQFKRCLFVENSR